ncbi:MAG TPA: hypothetical protein PLS66_01815 [Tepiditoga sp.]|nr:hypothetical protein [Tepiditoga sp.]
MKKILVLAVMMLAMISIFADADYPIWEYGSDNYTDSTNGKATLENEQVAVRIYQWVSTKFVSRQVLVDKRGAKLAGQSLTSFILIDKPGVHTDQILGVIPVMSNGNVNMKATIDTTESINNKTNIGSLVTKLNGYAFDNYSQIKGLTFTKDIDDALFGTGHVPTPVTSGRTVDVTNMIGNRVQGNKITGPEIILTADLDIPLNQGPTDDAVIVIDIEVSPRTTF